MLKTMLDTSGMRFKSIALILAVMFFILFGGMEFMHHHSGTHNEDNCQVCALSNTLINSFVQSKCVFLRNNTFVKLHFVFNLSVVELKVQNTNTGRSPPFSV